jgi:aldose 1-epimerase
VQKPISAALAALLFPTAAAAAQADRAEFGKLDDGTSIEAITLSNDKGVSARIITFGATLQSLILPDRAGNKADVVLGHDSLPGYVKTPTYFGSTVGRYANRIAGGRFTIDGKSYELAQNNNGNALHGGLKGFDKVVWKVDQVKSGPTASATFSYVSPDGEEGYPGTLRVTVIFTLNDANELGIEYRATTDKPTIVNLTNHALFDMAGEGSQKGVAEQKLTVPASAYTPVNASLIPTGDLQKVEGTVFDFRKPRVIGEGWRDGRDPQIVIGRGYDHNFALDKGLTAKPELAARLEDPASGRVMELLTTDPGIQVYTGNFIDGTLVGKQGHVYRMGDGIALEPQKFPDAPNQANFISARVDPGKPYRHVTLYRFSTSQP